MGGEVRLSPGGAKPPVGPYLDLVDEDLGGQGVYGPGVVRGRAQRRQWRSDQRDAGHSFPPAPVQVTHALAAAHRMADQRDVAQVQGLEQDGQVAGQRVVVVTAAWRIRPAVPAPVVPDTAQARLYQRVELVLPHPAVQQPGVGENHRLATTPALVVQPRAVSCREESDRRLLVEGARSVPARVGEELTAHRLVYTEL